MGGARCGGSRDADRGRDDTRSVGGRAAAAAVPGRIDPQPRGLSCCDVRKRPAPVGGAWYLGCVTDDALYQAMVARDPRFDGVFFVAVRTTGIYCRPICPARTPARSRVAFYQTAAEAERAGFRACFRCRPEVAPGHAPVDAVDTLVAAATARIAEGALNEHSLDELAAELKGTARHLRRALEARLGVSPVELAQSRRLALAKQLLQDTTLPLTYIAFAAGFQSVRRFNAVFAERMGRSPSDLRRVPPPCTRR